MTDRPPSRPEPLGVTVAAGGAHVAVPSVHATAIDVCVYPPFDPAVPDRELGRVRLEGRTGAVHHGFVAGLEPGLRYGLRAHGPWDPATGHRFNPAKLLLDPWATRLDRVAPLAPEMFDRRAAGAPHDDADSGPMVAKAVVEPAFVPPSAVPPPALPRPAFRWRDAVVYELHVRGFTRAHPDVPEAIRGTFAGLAHPAAIAHLVRLGITAVEIMPAAAWLDERHLAPLGLTNYWGYNPIALCAPDPRLAPTGWAEIRAATDALHAAGIAAILDVVLNHTGESDRLGPTVSLRGLDNATWYRLVPGAPADYLNDTGCGNMLALDRSIPLRLALDSLRLWVARGGFDGFRYDLATTLARRPDGFDPDAPLLAAIAQDPLLRDCVHIAEPWDIGPGGHQLGRFPDAWGEWNDRYRDTVRRLWRGDGGMVGALATRFAGSADIFAGRFRPLSRSLNFVTAHDGFTLADLVAHAGKHNGANGEDNRDGTNDNSSWNHGVEGATGDPAIQAARRGDVRALLATLILSRGTPMLAMGDELGRSQAGNNNAYAQDNALSWVDWGAADRDLAAFAGHLIALRKAHPVLTREAPLTGGPVDETGIPDVVWLRPDGGALADWEWQAPATRALVAALYAPAEDGRPASRAVVVLHAGPDPFVLTLPEPREGFAWTRALDTADPAAAPASAGSGLAVAPRSVVLAVETVAEAGGGAGMRRPADGAALDRLAAAAGIAPDWWDIDGRNHRVPDDTRRALLAAMRLPAGTTGEARDSLARLVAETSARDLPLAVTVREGEPARLRLGPGLAESFRRLDLVVETEAGAIETIAIAPGDGVRETITAADGRQIATRLVTLPALPLGRHRIRLADRPEMAAHWAVVPARCHQPEALTGGARRFGIAAHLYTLRRAGDAGIGDFTTLARLAERAAHYGAATIGLNPLHALFETEPERASPYSPTDRRFLDPLYIDLAALPEALLTPSVRAALDAEAGLLAAASARSAVDYAGLRAAKVRVLALAHQAFEIAAATGGGGPLAAAFEDFVRAQGPALQHFALHQAIVAATGIDDWHAWPAGLTRPDAAGTADFSARHKGRLRFVAFQQFLADRQLAEADRRARAAGLALGFYRDLAVGCAPDGAEAWSEQDRLMTGVSIGAPPDPFSAAGQVWCLPAPDPLGLARDGYRGFGQLIAANMAHAGALRIDHVLGLRRLFLVPDGATGREGAYLAQPADDLLGHLALESRRAGTLVVGEDLGTVPEGFREQLDHAGLLSYRVLWFERAGDGFVPPEHYPARAAACVSTHDLPTLAGWWSGADIDEDLALGRLAADAESAARARRAADRQRLVAMLAASRHLAAPVDPEGPFGPAIAAAVHGYVAATPSVLALVQADDLAGETAAVNLPGTDRERPNWRRRLALPVEHLFESELARAILDRMADRRA
ncbi:glycogen debranching protein GlgX [Prosthecodimorpha staleyi]|uniref:4-alpha-glucanotransferase n=1 Tax=Prosthecodimorpha staleyi TaxID=2840188 RepID=A0A947D9W4_9HYPH|nr:glycogen debranching protein GlgX [Prosthecodimorpha staleyi]MBT9292451.1 glycogen debranching protein GlgX [Prosthecodimorpha staleyi]